MVGKETIIMRETRILEFKETITNTFLKTVSAFSNYNGGTILFGVDDNGNVKGLEDWIGNQDVGNCKRYVLKNRKW